MKTLARGRNGRHWAYFRLPRSADGLCDLPYLPVNHVEEAVIREHAPLELGDSFNSAIRVQLDQVLRDQQKVTADFQASLTMKLAKLEHAEERLIDLVADGTLPTTKARTKLIKVKQETERLRTRSLKLTRSSLSASSRSR